jgi:hypothetical protein
VIAGNVLQKAMPSGHGFLRLGRCALFPVSGEGRIQVVNPFRGRGM